MIDCCSVAYASNMVGFTIMYTTTHINLWEASEKIALLSKLLQNSQLFNEKRITRQQKEIGGGLPWISAYMHLDYIHAPSLVLLSYSGPLSYVTPKGDFSLSIRISL